jgi:hypothetical protein
LMAAMLLGAGGAAAAVGLFLTVNGLADRSSKETAPGEVVKVKQLYVDIRLLAGGLDGLTFEHRANIGTHRLGEKVQVTWYQGHFHIPRCEEVR